MRFVSSLEVDISSSNCHPVSTLSMKMEASMVAFIKRSSILWPTGLSNEGLNP